MSSARLDATGVILTCPQCGQRNRTPYSRLSEAGVCGKCKSTLPFVSEPVEVERAADFDAMLASASVPVLVDFWAPWCGPCRMMAPELVGVAKTEAGQVLVAKLNTEQLPQVSGRFGIRSIPTLVLFCQGGEVSRTSGARPAAAIAEFVRGAAASV